MRAVIQKCEFCHILSDGVETGRISQGLVVLLGVKKGDTEKDCEYIVDKILNLRIFEDEDEKMNLSVLDVKGELAVVSQFTLYGDARKGRRPSFTQAEGAEEAQRWYEEVVKRLRDKGVTTATGKFQTHMKVHLVNDGPVTILLDSEKLF